MDNKLTDRDVQRLANVHPDLVSVVVRARELYDFAVVEGRRTVERQAQLVAKGASKTMNSRHITGHAVDLAPLVEGSIRWDWPLFFPLAEAVKQAAYEMNVPIVWGGTWKDLSETPLPITSKNLSKTFPDGPHFELDRKKYP